MLRKRDFWLVPINHKYLCLLFLNGFILCVYLLFSYQLSHAQTPTPTVQPSPVITGSLTLPSSTSLITPTVVPTRNIVTSPSPGFTPSSLSQTALPGESQVFTLALADLGYKDTAIEGPFGEAEFDLRLPSYWKILPGSSLTLHYVPELGLGGPVEPFELLVLFDDEIIHRTILNTFDEQFLNIPLPEIQLERRGDDVVKILLRSQGNCEGYSFTRLNIISDSSLTLNYQIKNPVLDLAYYPSPIYERTFFTQTGYLVLPDQPAQLPIEGALSLNARLGQLTENNLGLTTITASDLDPANLPAEHLIVVGTPESNPLLAYFNDASLLPASFQQRRLQLTSVGPNFIMPNTPLTYTLSITNNESVSASNLGLNVQLPVALQRVGCQACQRVNNTLHWEIDTLQPGATATVTLSFVYPFTTTTEPVSLAFELMQGQTVINTLTPRTSVEPEGQPGLTQTTASSPFFFVSEGRAIAETDGIIQLFPSPQRIDKAVLVVTGLTDEAVYKAGRALGTKPELLGMNGQVMLVQSIVQEESSPVAASQSFTLADLGYADRLITGITSQNTLYRFNLPLDWSLTSKAEVQLNFSHSSLLDPSSSSITLLFNNMPIASEALDESNIMDGQLRALLPPERARLGRENNLVARVELGALDPCVDAASSQFWATLKASSFVSLPHTLTEGPMQVDLDFLPVPFATNSNLSDVLFALPDSPSNVEYDAIVKTVSYLGSESDGNNFQPAALLGYPDNVDLSTFNLILIGRPTRNALLQEVNESLPQPFVAGTDTIQPQIDKVVFRLPDDLDLGYLQLITSSWSQNHALLALTGTSDLGLSWATQMITDPDKNEQLKGNLALAPNDFELHTTDTRELPTGGKVAAVTTAIPEAVIVGTATPTPVPPTPTPASSMASGVANPPSPGIPEPPEWVPYVVGSGIALILIILGIAYWQSRHRTRLRI